MVTGGADCAFCTMQSRMFLHAFHTRRQHLEVRRFHLRPQYMLSALVFLGRPTSTCLAVMFYGMENTAGIASTYQQCRLQTTIALLLTKACHMCMCDAPRNVLRWPMTCLNKVPSHQGSDVHAFGVAFPGGCRVSSSQMILCLLPLLLPRPATPHSYCFVVVRYGLLIDDSKFVLPSDCIVTPSQPGRRVSIMQHHHYAAPSSMGTGALVRITCQSPTDL